ncbi:MAG: pyridoxal phosphate-dependent aminotransferase [Cohaesibacter sp.]|nr:pyridoxal phosphate-dependent aminotransferase [Cohaesibacter sp.]
MTRPFSALDSNIDQALLNSLRPEARNAPTSGIIDIVNYAREKEGLVPLWVGEGSLPTPDFICEAAHQSLKAGETFYTWQRGLPELRQAIADYHQALYGRTFDSEHFIVTGSGMQAIQIAVRLVAGAGDEIVIPTPAWPNMAAATGLTGARFVEVPQYFSHDGWKLSIDDLLAACTDKTKAIFLNSPCNPTGWTASLDDLQQVLDFARARGLWIIADEIYTRFFYEERQGGNGELGPTAPSFYEICKEDDRILFVNSFSKNWAMTGWRIGWISAPTALGDVLENLVQYSTSGVAAFMQRAAIAALKEGEPFVAEQVERARAGRKTVLDALAKVPGAKFAPPSGAFYLFWGLEKHEDGGALAREIVDQANVGLAPGFAFGQSGTPFMRLCFATNPENLALAATRLQGWMAQR